MRKTDGQSLRPINLADTSTRTLLASSTRKFVKSIVWLIAQGIKELTKFVSVTALTRICSSARSTRHDMRGFSCFHPRNWCRPLGFIMKLYDPASKAFELFIAVFEEDSHQAHS